MKRNIILKQLGYSSFDEYLNSNHWNLVKKTYKSSGRPVSCYICNSNNTQIRHKTYKNIGKESFDDLIATCNNCHENIQKLISENLSIPLALAHIVLKRKKIDNKPKKTQVLACCNECGNNFCISKNKFISETNVMSEMGRLWACKNCRHSILKIPPVLVRKCGGFYQCILKLKTIKKFSVKKITELDDTFVCEELK